MGPDGNGSKHQTHLYNVHQSVITASLIDFTVTGGTEHLNLCVKGGVGTGEGGGVIETSFLGPDWNKRQTPVPNNGESIITPSFIELTVTG